MRQHDDMFDDVPEILGPCCACGRDGLGLRNLVMLHLRGPIDGTGWGCFQCGLPNHGAVAAVCDECIDNETPIRFACKGYATAGERVPREELTEPWDHDMSKHPLEAYDA